MTELISFKLDRALLVRIDGLTSNRSNFIRQAIEEKVKRAKRNRQSVWDALTATEGLDIVIRSARDKVKRINL